MKTIEDLNEYIEATLRLRKLDPTEYRVVVEETQRQINYLTSENALDRPHFEYLIEQGENGGYITHERRQAMSDLFYLFTCDNCGF